MSTAVWFDRTKTYARRLAECYLEFVVPVALFLAFNVALTNHAADPEKLGLLWLNNANLESDEERKARYPLSEPGSGKRAKAVQPAADADVAAE